MAARLINNFFKLFGIQLKKVKSLEIEKEHYAKIIEGAFKIFDINKEYGGRVLNKELSGLVFSKDRAMQLHALLTSYIEMVKNFSQLSILYKATNQKSKIAYEILKSEFEGLPIQFLEEKDFRRQVKEWLFNQVSDRIFFMTDDAVFLDSFDLNDALQFNPLNEIFSLTKGKDLQYCFTMDVKQALPVFTRISNEGREDLNFWKWSDCPNSPDWTYPLSLDGTFYLREEMVSLVENISFNNPNSLEANMQVFKSLFLKRDGICYDKVKLINVPCNLVQRDFNNRSTGYFSAEELQKIWEEGKRIDVKAFYGLSAFEAEHAKYAFEKK